MLKLRAPSTHTIPDSKAPQDAVLEGPPPDFMTGTWHICYSTFPMWKSKTDVRFSYTAVPNSKDLEDLVQSKKNPEAKDSNIRGISRAVDLPIGHGWAYHWRGKGLLAIASSKWEVLGWGDDESGNPWMVINFKSTIFTPSGIDIMSKSKTGISAETLSVAKEDLSKMDDLLGNFSMKKHAEGLFQVPGEGRPAL